MNSATVSKPPESSQLPPKASPPPSSWMQWLSSSIRLHFPLLIALVAYCFGRTLSSYFLADDFSEVRYVARIFHGEPQLIWSNFIGSYMQNPSIQVLRPWMLMTQIIDYLFWGSRPFGFYLSNFLYYLGDTVLLYAVVKQLTRAWPAWRSGLAAFFAAALFAGNPLHCESVSWMVGRVDVDCCFYYLLSLVLFLQAHQKHSTTLRLLGLISFWLALFTKEMAIGLPLVVAAAIFLQTSKQQSLTGRFREAAAGSLPLWLSLPAYFCWRYLALGTLLGGYTGTIGASQSADALSRWLDPDTIGRILLPFSAAVFPEHHPYAVVIGNCLLLLTALVAVRALANQLSLSLAAFLAIWALTTVAPIYRLWGLGLNLEGARFYFFLTLVLSAFWPLLLLQPDKAAKDSRPSLPPKLLIISVTALVIMTAVQAKVAYATNVLWVHAGQEVASFLEESQKLAAKLQPDHKLIILGIPDNHGGAHQILNAHTVEMMLQPPFSPTDISHKFVLFHPLWFGHSELINAGRFKQQLANPQVDAVLCWDKTTKKFQPVNLRSAAITTLQLPPAAALTWYPSSSGHLSYKLVNGVAQLLNLQSGDGLRIDGLHLNPLAADFLEFDLQTTGSTVQPQLKWNNQTAVATAESIKSGHGWQHLRLRPSNYWRWFTSGTIESLQIQFPAIGQAAVCNFRLAAATKLVPQLSITGGSASPSGVYPLLSRPLTLQYDGSKISGCQSLVLEISQPNYFFDHCLKSAACPATARTVRTASPSGRFILHPLHFPGHGLYQIRSCGLDAAGKIIGEYSDVVTIEH